MEIFRRDESWKIWEKSTEPITADEEYKKNPKLKKSEINELKKWVESQPHLPPNIPEEQLILFHHSCYFKMEDTKSCINIFYHLKTGSPEYFIDRDIHSPSLKVALNTLEYGCLPVRDPNGYQIIVHRLAVYDASKYVFMDGVKLLAMSIDACLRVDGTSPGVIFLFDMKGVKLTHLTRLSINGLRKFFLYVQEGLPVRLRAIHVLNTRPLVDKIMMIIKPFMKKELMSVIHFHGPNELEKVYEYLPKNCLPSDFGGELDSCANLHAAFTDWMERLKPYFDEDERKFVLVGKSKREVQPEKEISLQTLELD